MPGVESVIGDLGPVAVLDNNATLDNTGIAYVVLKAYDDRETAWAGI